MLRAALKLAKLILPRKMADRMVISSIEEIRELVPKDNLPIRYGGNLEMDWWTKCLTQTNISQLLE